MKDRIIFLLKYWLGWVFFVLIGRLIFMSFFASTIKRGGFENFIGSIWYGLRLDFSIAAYFTVIVCIAILLSVFFEFFRKPFFYLFYSFFLLVTAFLLIIIDVGSYQAWGTKVDPGFLSYLQTPKEAFASIKSFPLLPVFIVFLAFSVLSFVLLRKYFVNICSARLNTVRNELLTSVALLCFTAVFIIPMRGGLQGLPINQSSAYFSKNNFSNLTAINANFNFFFNLFQGDTEKDNPFNVMSTKEAEQIAASYYNSARTSQTKSANQIKTDSATNVIIIIWESFTHKATTRSMGGVEVTPKFNEWKKEGIYFSNIYATGDRTDKGIAGILSGYPAQPTTSILKNASKSQALPLLSKEFSVQGYFTSFYYGGEGDFANMNAYLSAGNFDVLQTYDEFEIGAEPTNWGYHDGDVKDKIVTNFPMMQTPFFLTWLTLTSHQPYKTPIPTTIQGTDETALFFNSLHYSDEVIDQFLLEAKKQTWWNNTLLVILADHGHRLPATGRKFDDFRIPVLFLGGAIKEPGLVIDKVGAQTDIAATLMEAIGINNHPFKFSNNLFDESRIPIAYFSFMNGFGFIESEQKFIFDNVGKQIVEQSKLLTPVNVTKAKALQQYFFQDYLDR
jgi:phosphoglycerol transferase MdoB-like AlkP superfamily enzyme